MNYLLLLLLFIVCLFILSKFIFPQNKSNISSDYESVPKKSSELGFIKPEHRLLHILNKVVIGELSLAYICLRQ